MTLEFAGRLMGEAIAGRMDFDIWWAAHHSMSNSCIHCGRRYKGRTRGWLVRHYKRIGHWREATQP